MTRKFDLALYILNVLYANDSDLLTKSGILLSERYLVYIIQRFLFFLLQRDL